MKERNILIIKLLASHVFLVPILLSGLLISNIPLFPAIFIPQTILVILFFAGYWEFFGIWVKWLICILCEAMILIALLSGVPSGNIISEGLIFVW